MRQFSKLALAIGLMWQSASAQILPSTAQLGLSAAGPSSANITPSSQVVEPSLPGIAPTGAITVPANGIALSVQVSGQGDTVLLFESGFGQGPDVWNDVIARLPNQVVAVRYARAGVGHTAEHDASSGLSQHLNDLAVVADHFATAKRLILVGHSYGGLLVSEFARQHRSQVAALLLIDPAVAQQRHWFKQADAQAVADEDALLKRILPPILSAQLDQLNREMDQVAPQVQPLPSDLPIVLLTSSRIEREPMVFVETAAGKQQWLALHRALVAGSQQTRHLELSAVGHNIMQDDPETVWKSVQSLL